MLLMSQNRDMAVDSTGVIVYIAANKSYKENGNPEFDGTFSIRADWSNGRAVDLAVYPSESDAISAMRMFSHECLYPGKEAPTAFAFPTEERLQEYIDYYRKQHDVSR